MRLLLTLIALCLPVLVNAQPSPIATAIGSKGVMNGEWPADVPKVLSDNDVTVYKALFDNQRRLRRAQVQHDLSRLEDKETLMGNLIAIRLLHPLTRAPYSDLASWMEDYHDLSAAPTIFDLAKDRAPKGGKLHLRRPSVQSYSIARYSAEDDDEAPLVFDAAERSKLLRRLKYYRQQGKYTTAIDILNKPNTKTTLTESTWGGVAVTLARSMMNAGEYAKAETLMNKVDADLDIRQPAARWLVGMAQYRQDKIESAAKSWRTLAYDVPVGSSYYSQAAWWAGTAYEKLGKAAMARVLVNMAAQDPTSFYGQLAAAKLDRGEFIRWNTPHLDKAELTELMKDAGLRRVIALAQIGEYGLAQAELRSSYERFPYDYDETLLALTMRLHLAGASLTLSRNLNERDRTYYAGMYPLIEHWLPSGQVQVDPALLHAIIRQESAFDPAVESYAGARGLMQLMPATASYIRRQQGERPLASYRMFEPATNVGLGQDYLFYLKDKVGDNLLVMIASYNAGPGNVGKWVESGLGEGDPLMFIESMPFNETRNYVKKVLSNYWLYQQRFGAPTPTLHDLAHGEWPLAFLKPVKETKRYPQTLPITATPPEKLQGTATPASAEQSALEKALE